MPVRTTALISSTGRLNKQSKPFSIGPLFRLYSEEGKDKFTVNTIPISNVSVFSQVRSNVLGHMQQGGWPSPFDRNVATKMAAKTVNWLIEQLNTCAARDGTVHAEDESTATLLGMRTRAYKFQPVADIKNITNFELRTPSEPQWWMKLRSIMAILAQHDSTYEVEGLDPAVNTDGETHDH